jgi:hypothetical protein
MWTQPFEPAQRSIWVEVKLAGPFGQADFTFILDTGSPWTIIDASVLHDLGYSARTHGTVLHPFWAIGGTSHGYRLRVERLEVMGFGVEHCLVATEDLPRAQAVDGIIGMDLIAGHVLHIDAVAGLLTVDP